MAESELEKRAEELRNRIETLCNEYEEFAIMCVLESDERKLISIAGNLYPVCAAENLEYIIIKNKLTHNKEENKSSINETKH